MQKPSSISRGMERCLTAIIQKDYEAALTHLFPALDKTAKRRRPQAGVGERIRRFVGDQQCLIWAMGMGVRLRGEISVDGNTFPEVIYKFGRTSIMHEGELDKRLQLNCGNFLSLGREWSLPVSFVSALCVAVISARENANEKFSTLGGLTIFGRKWSLNELWGAEDTLRAMMERAPLGDWGDISCRMVGLDQRGEPPT